MKRSLFHGRQAVRGFTLIELMIGMAIGLFIVAIACAMLTNSLGENRRLLLEARVQQDLRAAADLIVRDLRRAGYWRNAEKGIQPTAEDSAAMPNPYSPLSLANDGDTATAITYARATDGDDAVANAEQFGFRLNKGVVETQVGDGNWQAMTDPASVTITGFAVTMRKQTIGLQDFCAAPCPLESTACPPRQEVREFVVSLSGRATGNAQVRRSLESRVRVRNDVLVGACTAA